MFRFLKKIARKLPFLREIHQYILALEAERDRLKEEKEALKKELEAKHAEEVAALKEEIRRYWAWVPPGDLRSPIPDVKELEDRQAELFGKVPPEVPGVEIYPAEQIGLMKELRKHAMDAPFKEEKVEGLRYHAGNPDYPAGDAALLYAMIRKLKPRRVVEIGSGYSTAVILDTNENHFGKNIAVTVIDPEPDVLRSLLKKGDAEKVKLLTKSLHEVPVESTFGSLTSGDLVVVSSSHVVKTGSDVNHLVFNVFPKLKTGVHVNVNAVYYPFEYPQGWVLEGRAWNEAYLLRAFFEYNSAFELVLFGSYLQQVQRAVLEKEFPFYASARWGGLFFKRK